MGAKEGREGRKERCDIQFLTDRTNGRAIGIGLYRLQCCVRLSSSVCTECIVAKRCVLEQNLLLRAYRKTFI